MPLYSDRCYAVTTVKSQSYVRKFAPATRYGRAAAPGGHFYRIRYSETKVQDIARVSGVHFIYAEDCHVLSHEGTYYYDKDKFELDSEGFVVPKDRTKYVMTHRGGWDWKESPQFVVDLPGGFNVSHGTYLRKQRGEPSPPPQPSPEVSDSDSGSEQQPGAKRARTDNGGA